MAEKKFTVIFKGGNTRTVYAARGDEEEEEDGYIFFRAPNGADTCKRSGRTRLPLMSCLESPLPSPAGQRGNRF
jgi:hypothetical protein